MPEGHMIHGLARDHRALFARRPVTATSPQGRFADGAARISGRVLEDVEPYGKHLFYDFGGGDLVHVHLGLFGRFLRHAAPAPGARDTVRLRLENHEAAVDLIGATECALVDPARRDEMVTRLGADPLRADADREMAWKRLQRRRRTIGEALMDQAVIAGVGNVYRAEVLAITGIHPERGVPDVKRDEFDRIWDQLSTWLHHALEDQVIITVDPEEIGKPRADIVKGEALWVYKQEACRRCGGPVRRWDLSGRWAYACDTCQT